MRITWQMDYLIKDPKSGIYGYRRRVPKEVQPTVGKREIIHSFKTTDEAIALKSYKAVHAKAEATLGKELRKSREQIVYEATMADLKAADLVPVTAENAGPVALTDDERFNALYRCGAGQVRCDDAQAA